MAAAMDATTLAVREMYEQYPYPAGGAVFRAGTDARLLLSYVERARSGPGPIRVLDAGCGRGVGLLGAAAVQPDVQFVGADINRVALAEAKRSAQRMQLGNVRLEEVDLMTLDGLEVPEGGFDVIVSSGVLHHLSDPKRGLSRLREVLAPHGVLVLMLYATHGRTPLDRLRQAAGLLLDESAPLAERVEPARQLAQTMREDVLAGTPWDNTADVVDVELVDRVLNVQETSYTVPQLWSLLDGGALSFVRWLEPQQWSLDRLPPGPLREQAAQLSEYDRYRLAELIGWRRDHQLVAAHRDNPRRSPLARDAVASTLFAVSPEATFELESRSMWGAQRIESLAYRVRDREARSLASGPLAKAVLMLRDQNLPFDGASFLQAMEAELVPEVAAASVLRELEREEVVYRPHLVDAR